MSQEPKQAMQNKEIMEAEKRIQQQVSQAIENQRQILVEEQNNFYDKLVVEGRQERAVIPEEVFKERFLPYFCGEKSLNEKEGKEVIGLWIGLVGAPMAEGTVVNQAGERLFDVPPMLDSSMIDNSRRALKSFSHVSAMTQLQEDRFPNSGLGYFLEQTGEIQKTIITPQPEVFNNNANRWKAIFARYGKDSKEPGTEKAETTGIENHDDFDYD